MSFAEVSICFLLFEPYCYINQFIKKKSQSTYCGKNDFKRKYVEEFLSKKEKELMLKIKHKKKDNRHMASRPEYTLTCGSF